jgi:glycosidase
MRISHPEYLHQLEVDDQTGLPTALLWTGKAPSRLDFHAPEVLLSVNGEEVRSATGGIDYAGAATLQGVQFKGRHSWSSSQEGDRCSLAVQIGPIAADLEYLFRRHGPALTVGLALCGDPDASLLIRNLTFSTTFALPAGDWQLNAPGNGLRRDVPLAEVTSWTGISPVGGLRGSSAVLHLGSAEHNVALWIRQELEVSDIRIQRASAHALALELATNFAGDLSRMGRTSLDLFDLDLRVGDFGAFAETFQSWLRHSGHTTPANPPAWIRGGSIWEAQIGFSVFYPDHRYQPYPTVADLTADLPRIAALGFDVIQLMPRQPYPSYNVHDYWDIATSYGDPAEMQALVAACHRLGLHIILDVLLHGVLDQESIATAAGGVRAGPYADLIGAPTSDSFAAGVGEWSNYEIAWSRHIIDFEPYWHGGSPAVSPLLAEHPDWFFRDSYGEVAGIYTKAFDARNPAWQAYFTAAMQFLLAELQIDGFRFDAPTYNDFSNWAAWARHRAGMSALACVPLFEQLRAALKALNPEALLYTEPSGILLRRSMDLNYNYDEQWLVTAIMHPGDARPWGVTSAKGVARWIQDRDAFLPRGALTAHHIDSHDTFWWPSWGSKWRREQFALEDVRLLTVMFMAMPGPYMLFVGGEEGVDDVLRAVNTLKRQTPGWAEGEIVWLTGAGVPESVFGILRRSRDNEVVLLVNLGEAAAVRFATALAGAQLERALELGTIGAIDTAGSTLTVAMGAKSALALRIGR